MTEGWKQVWEDIINALSGREPKPEEEKSAQSIETGSEPPALAPIEMAEDTGFIEKIEPLSPDLEPPPVTMKLDQENAIPGSEPFSLVDTSAATELIGVELTVERGDSPDAVASDEETPLVETAAPLTPLQVRLGRLKRGGLYSGLLLLFLIVLWFSGGNRWWARLTAPKPPAADVVATFNGGQITIADIETHLKLLEPDEYQAVARSPELLSEIAEDLITDELIRQWAAARSPDKDEDFRHTMQHISESLNLESLDLQRHEGEIQVAESEIQNYYRANQSQFGEQTLDQVREQIRQVLIAEQEQGYIEEYIQRLRDNASITRNFELLDVPPPSEDDLRRYYDANTDLFKLPRMAITDEMQFPISDNEVASRQNADDALLKVRSGATFAEVTQAITNTLLTTGIQIPEGERDPAWDTAVFALTEGELSDVFRAGESFYIVRLNEIQPARTQTMDEVRSTVLAAVQQQKTEEWFAANSTKTLFTLKGKQYSLGQFYQEYQELSISLLTQFAGSEGMKELAEQLIERLLLVEDAYDQLLDVQNKPLTDEARLQVLKQMMHQEEVDDKIQVGDEEIQKFYDENIALMAMPPQARIRYIRIGLGTGEDEQQAARSRADEAYRKLVPGLFQQGVDFATVAQEYSEDPETAGIGGEFPGWIGESSDILAEAQLHPFHETVINLQPNEISQPFTFGDSLYIVQVIERTEPEQLTLEQAKPYIQEILTQQKHQELLVQLSGQLVDQASVVIYQDVLLAYIDKLRAETPTPGP